MSPAEDGGHSGEPGGRAGCSSGCHPWHTVEPPAGQTRTDSGGHPAGPRAEGPVLMNEAGANLSVCFQRKLVNKMSFLSRVFPAVVSKRKLRYKNESQAGEVLEGDLFLYQSDSSSMLRNTWWVVSAGNKVFYWLPVRICSTRWQEANGGAGGGTESSASTCSRRLPFTFNTYRHSEHQH